MEDMEVLCTSSLTFNWRLAPTFEINNNGYAVLKNSKIAASFGSGYHYSCSYDNRVSCYHSTDSVSLLYVYQYGGKDGSACYIDLGAMNQSTIEKYMEDYFQNNSVSSTVKKEIDSWYNSNIVAKGYTKYVDNNSVWCNDRTMTSGPLYSSSAGFGETLFAATENRKLNTSFANPKIKESNACTNVRDRFTTSSANTGNKALVYPVGLLTADEVVVGGLSFTTASKDSYLNSGNKYWTMTPYAFSGNDADWSLFGQHYVVNASGQMSKDKVSSTNTIRPSLSLKPDTLVYGRGTKDEPYEVVME